MNQLVSTWAALDTGKRIVVLLAMAAGLLAVIGLVRLASAPNLNLLYSGLDPVTAGEVVASLEQKGIVFEVRNNSIYVDAAQRDQTRLTLAAEGLPANGSAGYELLDGLSGFGTTSQMFDAAYWRAKEGELARTIVASPDIRAARVHIANPVRQAFSRGTSGSAAVTVNMSRGRLSDTQALAIRYLISSAVAGLDADQVAVIDAVAGTVLPAGNNPAGVAEGEDTQGRAAALKANIERLLSARVGPGKAAVEVMIDADMDSQTISERVIDPASRVTISSDTEEQSETASGSDSGAVTVASNLPDGATGGPANASNSQASQTRERLNFEVSETRRERIILPGQIRRISVAVLVDGIAGTGADGQRSWEPRSAEELAALKSLVESAIGFDPARGDIVTMQSLEFPPDGIDGTLAEASTSILPGSLMPLIQTAVLALVALLLGLFVVRPILTQREALPAPETFAAREGEIMETAQLSLAGKEALLEVDPKSIEASKIANLRAMITERSEDSAEVLRRWIETPDLKEETA